MTVSAVFRQAILVVSIVRFYSSLSYLTVSFAGLGFLAFYLAGKLHLFRRGHAVSQNHSFLPPL